MFNNLKNKLRRSGNWKYESGKCGSR